MSRLSEALAKRSGSARGSLPKVQRGDFVRIEFIKQWSKRMKAGDVWEGQVVVPPRTVRSGAVMLCVKVQRQLWLPASPEYITMTVIGEEGL